MVELVPGVTDKGEATRPGLVMPRPLGPTPQPQVKPRKGKRDEAIHLKCRFLLLEVRMGEQNFCGSFVKYVFVYTNAQ